MAGSARLIEAATAAAIPLIDERVPPARGRFTPTGVLWHHSASNAKNWAANIGLYQRGREGLPGPVVQLVAGRAGQIHAVTDGRANHAGRCSARVLREIARGEAPERTAAERGLRDTTVGNRQLIGIEIDLDGRGERLHPGQLEATIGITAGLCVVHGWDAGHVAGHAHITRRKVDPSAPNLPPWPEIRRLVNERVSEIRRGIDPDPPTVAPQFVPPLILEGIVAEAACPTGGVWLMSADGDVYAFGGAPYLGGPNDDPRRDRGELNYRLVGAPARLEPSPGGYTVITGRGKRYAYGGWSAPGTGG